MTCYDFDFQSLINPLDYVDNVVFKFFVLKGTHLRSVLDPIKRSGIVSKRVSSVFCPPLLSFSINSFIHF